MGTPFKITIDACQPDKGTYVKIIMSQGPDKTIWDDPVCGVCPYSEEELKETCPNPEDREKIYAYDDINLYEAENETQKITHETILLQGNQPVSWRYECEKCIKCEDDLGLRVLLASEYYKTCEPCGAETDRSLCNGGGRLDRVARSKPFSRQCAKIYDVYAEVTAVFDNWGYVKDGYGTAKTTKCSNEGSDSCDQICSKTEDIGPLNPVTAGTDLNAAEQGMVEVGVAGWAINAPHGGPHRIAAFVRFYFKPKPRNK
jgi:hypothetical protein